MILAKTGIYRVYSFIILFFIALLFTHNLKTAFFGSFGVEVIKLIQYYIFERLWRRTV